MAIIRCYWEEFSDPVCFPPLSDYGAKSPSFTLGVIFKFVWEAHGEHYTYPGICLVWFACVSVLVQTLRSVYSVLQRGREKRALCKLVFGVQCSGVFVCVYVCGWIPGSLGTVISVFGQVTSNQRPLLCLSCWLPRNPIIRAWADHFNEGWLGWMSVPVWLIFVRACVYFRVRLRWPPGLPSMALSAQLQI